VGARSFMGNPYDGHTLAEQLGQVTILTEDTVAARNSGRAPRVPGRGCGCVPWCAWASKAFTCA